MNMINVKSPDGNIVFEFIVGEGKVDKGCIFYSIHYKGKTAVQKSQLGLTLKNMPPLCGDFEIANASHRSYEGSWKPVYGERGVIPDKYNETVAELCETGGRKRRLCIQIRVYDEGAAFRYILPEQPGMKEITIVSEDTQFVFPDFCMFYEEHGTEGEYKKVSARDIKDECERPLTVEYDGTVFACLTEAELYDYPRMLLSQTEFGSGTLKSDLSSEAAVSTPLKTPWRVLILGGSPGDLLENNYIVPNLNPPCAICDTSWIVPGKIMRDTSLSTRGAKACIDFALCNNLQYIEFDAGWYGHEYDEKSDATKVNVPLEKAAKIPGHDGLDLRQVIEYGRERGVGVFLYVNRLALEKQLDELLPLYKAWGIKGIKFGFVQVGPQKWTKWLVDAVKKCAEHELLVDIHDAYRPTGLSRTYPNLLTQEGVRGNEHMPTAKHNATLPFVRFPAGAADVTICYYSERIKTTHAHQLAMAVVAYSPLQFLFWYDSPSRYGGEKEIEFFKQVPTVWDETKVLSGQISEYAIIARRKGDEWFVGGITDETEREFELPLQFLCSSVKYKAHIYADGNLNDETKTHVVIRETEIASNQSISFVMKQNGGCAMWFEKINTD